MSPMLFISFFVLCFVMGSYKCSEVVVLDTSNFEKLTQASTGHTTGDWFVKVNVLVFHSLHRIQPLQLISTAVTIDHLD
jgi:hypothetical protein